MSIRQTTEYVCDQCGRTASDVELQADRKPWWELQDSPRRFDQHFCSPSCLVGWAIDLRESNYGQAGERR